MIDIYCITDYKGIFGSKFDAKPYRSGFDKNLLEHIFREHGYRLIFIEPTMISFNEEWKSRIVLYTSSEEYGLYYKDFLEDILFGLKEIGAKVIPDPIYLKANNNKVFMEIVARISLPPKIHNLKALYFGSYDEVLKAVNDDRVNLPAVIKLSAGAKSRGVFMVRDKKEILAITKDISKTASLKIRVKEIIRGFLHKGYKKESFFQGKFIVQNFIPNLLNDWKVLIYGNRYFLLKRSVRKNDFRASGSGLNYKSGSESEFPMEMLDYLKEFYESLNVPNLSIDFGYDGKIGYVFEFQAVHYGSYTQQKSFDYFEFYNNEWLVKKNDLTLEAAYSLSIIEFLKRVKD